MEDNLNFVQMEDILNFFQMEDNLFFFTNWRRPQLFPMEYDHNFFQM